MPTFSLNDETKYNSYGFRIVNAGLNLDRFRDNPVMLDGHRSDNESVIGRWGNIHIEDGRLKATPEFDPEDERAKAISGKVDRGFLKGASLGIVFDPEKMQVEPTGKLVLSEAEVLEASIVAVPANSGAIRLYAAETHELMTEEDVKIALSGLTPDLNINSKDFKTQKKMEKFALSVLALSALGLENADDATKVSNAIEQLNRSYQAEKTAREALQADLDKQKNAQAEALVASAIKEGKLTADTKEQFEEMAKANYELAAKVIGAMPGKQSLAGSVANAGQPAVKTLEDFLKLPLQEQLAFKEEHPDEYKALLA